MRLALPQTVVAALVVAASSFAMAAPPAVSDFNSSIDGWTGTAPADISWSATGGNTGGYIRFEDNTAGLSLINAPSKFLGDWSALDGTGAISYDQILFSTGTVLNFGPYTVRLSGPSGSATWTGSTPSGTTGWVSQTAPLTQSAWTLNSGSWNGLLSNVTSFQIVTELVGNPSFVGDITGIDNVAVVPEPGTYAMLALGLGALGVARVRRSRRIVRLS